MKYIVPLRRTAYMIASIEVEAEDPEEAKTKATDQAGDQDFKTLDYDTEADEPKIKE